MDTIPFSSNWNNKLSGKYYTTLRLASAKYQPGNILNITLKGKYLHKAEIVEVKFMMMNMLNDFVIGLDMGLTLHEGKTILLKMYPSVDFSKQRLVLVLIRVIDYKKEKNISMEVQTNAIELSEEEKRLKSEQEVSDIYDNHTPHKLKESQEHNARLVTKGKMTYMIRRING